jgi:hypothetical protein
MNHLISSPRLLFIERDNTATPKVSSRFAFFGGDVGNFEWPNVDAVSLDKLGLICA